MHGMTPEQEELARGIHQVFKGTPFTLGLVVEKTTMALEDVKASLRGLLELGALMKTVVDGQYDGGYRLSPEVCWRCESR